MSGALPFRVRFLGRPDLDSESFALYAGTEPGDEFTHEDGSKWRLREIESSQDDKPDTLVYEPAD